jgi:tetratricopeptide (TPR) repeat protein
VTTRIWFIAAFLMAGLFAPLGVRADIGWEESFFKANQAYREGRFEEAIDGYVHLIRAGRGTGPVYYNLGNAYVKTDQLGRAIWAYERALCLTPRDPDLLFNLSHARDQTRDAVGNPRTSLETVFFWLGSFSLVELFWGFAAVNLVFWSVLLIRLFKRSEWFYYLLLLTMSVWLVAGLSFGLKWYQTTTDDRAVILQEEVSVLAGPNPGDTVLFKLHEGTVVRHERSEDGWSLIRLSDKKRGWVAADAIGRISDPVPVPKEKPSQNLM